MNDKVIGLIRTGGVLVLFVIGVLLIMNAMGTTATVDPETQEIMEDSDKVTGSVTFSLFLVYACLGVIALFTIWAIIKNPKRFIPAGIGIAVFGVICLIGYGMASDEIIPELLKHPDATASAHKMGGAGIKITFILVFLAVALMAVQTVRNLMKYFSK
ncbi:MAG: hypothetical protein R2780_08560 [Crocinitomicaceae bacterium]